MYPAMSAEGLLMPSNPDTYDAVLRNASFMTTRFYESTHVMNFIREHQRPKISPLLPNPTYLPAFYKNCHYSYVNQKGIPLKLDQYGEKIIVQSYKRKYQVDASCSEVRDRKTSTSSPHKALSYFDSHSTKTDLLQSITKVDGKIAEVEFELLERKKLEDAKKPSFEQLKQVSRPINYCLFKKIIEENYQKAQEAHSKMLNLGPQLDFPLYKQPCDTAVYHENKRHFISFKEKLKMHLREKRARRVKTQKSLLRLYSHLACKWKDNINKIENSRRHKSEEAKTRNYFETVFPELQKKKLTRERPNRSGDHVSSEADYQEILLKLQFENLKYTWLKSSSAHPPALLDSEQRGKFFCNQNNLDTDIKGTGDKEFFNLWTHAEKAIFEEKFIQYSKDFGGIASFLNKKSVGDCIRYYYLTKKRKNLKICGKSKKMQQIMLKQFCNNNGKLQLLPTSNNSMEK